MGIASMAAGMFAGGDPWEIVPARYRAAKPTPRVMTAAEREAAQEVALANLGQLFRQMKAERQ